MIIDTKTLLQTNVSSSKMLLLNDKKFSSNFSDK